MLLPEVDGVTEPDADVVLVVVVVVLVVVVVVDVLLEDEEPTLPALSLRLHPVSNKLIIDTAINAVTTHLPAFFN